ncbi:hypothetical protein BY996DRAFT_3585433 [Phakopsora pachyrhizi]|nr:hypothetical protein BY996DRAFT_3585433 [Phakopsora pachyrhizi]
MVGGRIAYLSWCMKHKDMFHAAQAILEREKQWLLSRIGLIVDCDDDAMDEQKMVVIIISVDASLGRTGRGAVKVR